MAGTTRSVGGFLMEFPTSILPNIGVEPTREDLIELHWLISENMATVASNLSGGRHRNLTLTTTTEDYME